MTSKIKKNRFQNCSNFEKKQNCLALLGLHDLAAVSAFGDLDDE